MVSTVSICIIIQNTQYPRLDNYDPDETQVDDDETQVPEELDTTYVPDTFSHDGGYDESLN